MSIHDETNVLRRIPLFAGLPDAKLKLLAFTCDRVTFAAGQMLFAEGDEADAAYVIITGEAEVTIASARGPERINVMSAHSVVGEIGIICDVPRTATVRATSALDTLRIGKDQFLKLLNEFPELAAPIMTVLGRRLAEQSVMRSKAGA